MKSTSGKSWKKIHGTSRERMCNKTNLSSVVHKRILSDKKSSNINSSYAAFIVITCSKHTSRQVNQKISNVRRETQDLFINRKMVKSLWETLSAWVPSPPRNALNTSLVFLFSLWRQILQTSGFRKEESSINFGINDFTHELSAWSALLRFSRRFQEESLKKTFIRRDLH